jgi:hypothetical protein
MDILFGYYLLITILGKKYLFFEEHSEMSEKIVLTADLNPDNFTSSMFFRAIDNVLP